ncbi:unnamed protein product [Rotaria socialis]|uniref:Uncharacterized protein n=1 Tax=Rotaria socialis TaxID=392032 RepID=A0A820R8X4_9BILA|nr:unnamed protein product [Rotaria socialis]CAF3505639.1 unnamed protein product [Rotaria socialis]CAF3538138.1 unnamed protein product [Rotaria socialis]CAF3552757.1 unnamed protein product [Rotaria socialis]CAF3588164.1 unnamed protein product [Rotaria socialis]
MHKSYQSTRPSANRLLQKRWDDKYFSEHRLLVRDARPTVDTRPPRTYMHLHMKLKKLQIEEERSATIERDNRILLEKMSNIMRTTGSIDNHNDYESKSLNHEKRRRELLRVSRENSTMIKRIVERKPDISRTSWSSSWSKNLSYLDNISKYDLDWHESKPISRQLHSREPSSRRPTTGPRENRNAIKNTAETDETETTKLDKNEA